MEFLVDNPLFASSMGDEVLGKVEREVDQLERVDLALLSEEKEKSDALNGYF